MNKKINLAVAGAVLLASATAANAGIIIPAGEWTMDINGNVNVYATMINYDDASVAATGALSGAQDGTEDSNQSINTGLLPAWLGFTGTTRQNDLDVSFTISFQPNVSDNTYAGDNNTPLNRQAFMTFGDKSWGSVKLGKDLGIFAADAILGDMTLLGVGAGYGNSGTATTLGGIGTGYIYPAWKGQISYTTPNMNGFQATIGITNPNQASANANYQDTFGIEAKASYAITAGAATGKVWVSGASYDVTTRAVAAVVGAQGTGTVADTAPVAAVAAQSYDATVADIGVNLNVGNLGLTGYYYSGSGVGTTVFGALGATAAGAERDSDGGYVQATYVIPTGTKLGVSYGVSRLDLAGAEATTLLDENNRWTVGAYHPLTKHLNLVAEYNQVESKSHAGAQSESDALSLGAILFF
jgi:predicted porin